MPNLYPIETFDRMDFFSPLDKQLYICKTQLEYLSWQGRLKYNMTKDNVIDVINAMDQEDERTIQVRVRLQEVVQGEGFELWTMYGRLTSMCIIKPRLWNQFGDLTQWKLCMIFEDHQAEVVSISVAQALGSFDAIMAWYALWRKWPMYYPAWDWATFIPGIGYPDKETSIPFISNSDEYKIRWMEVQKQQGGRYPLQENNVVWTDEHLCPYEKKVHREKLSEYHPRGNRVNL